jgi:ribosome biogenesis GTPase A
VGELKKYLEDYSEEWPKSSLRIGLVGYPNVGKSTLINLLTGSKEKVSSVSGTTRKTAWIRSGKLRFMDSPGVIPFGDKNVKVGLASAKDPHKIKNPERIAYRIIENLKKKKSKSLLEFYSVKDGTVDEIFERIGEKKKYLLKGGVVDERRTGIRVVEDWQKGKIKLK